MSFMETLAGMDGGRADRPEFTIAVAQVTSNVDLTGAGRVQISLPWLPGTEPWARVAVPGAGSGRGTYIIPHEGDEVLVAFNREDVMDCYVVGSLWNAEDQPPLQGPLDPSSKIAIRTEAGHEIQFDDVAQTIHLTTSTGQTVELGPTKIALHTQGSTASVELTQAGGITISATTSLTIKAPKVTIEGTGQVEVTSNGTVAVNGGQNCRIQATTILLN